MIPVSEVRMRDVFLAKRTTGQMLVCKIVDVGRGGRFIIRQWTGDLARWTKTTSIWPHEVLQIVPRKLCTRKRLNAISAEFAYQNEIRQLTLQTTRTLKQLTERLDGRIMNILEETQE